MSLAALARVRIKDVGDVLITAGNWRRTHAAPSVALSPVSADRLAQHTLSVS